MENPKIDTELQLSLELTEEERKKSLDLDVGYSEVFQEWELIIKYSGDLTAIETDLSVTVTRLLNEYAIIRIQENMIERLAEYPEIELIEKPKSLIFEKIEGIQASCINPVKLPPLSLTGAGVVVAVIDSGIDYAHPDFRNPDGSTRILQMWDQSVPGNPPNGYRIGTLYDREDINRALNADSLSRRLELVPEVDLSGHGTHVTGIAAGNGRASNGRYTGAAPEADLLIVKLASGTSQGFPRTTELIQGMDWVMRYCLAQKLPVAVNISFGNNYGDHVGNSLLEQYMQDVANLGKSVIVAGAGNEGNTGRHASGNLGIGIWNQGNRQSGNQEIEFAVSPYEAGVNLQIWKEYGDDFEIGIRTPSGTMIGPFSQMQGKQTVIAGDTNVSLYYGEPTPYNVRQEIYIALIPVQSFIEEGIWTIFLYPQNIRSGRYDIWLPVAGATNENTEFLRPNVELTLTIPSTGNRVVTVGAYDSRTDSYAVFSGRGGMNMGYQKPDLVAPGVDITSAAPGGGYATRSGTSMAAPFVSGGAALLMEWGILQGNDPFLYGEKMKAYLMKGARELPGFLHFPNPQVGWGALCVKDSIPG